MIETFQDYDASVIVTSDTCSKDPSLDTSGQYVVDQLNSLGFSTVSKHIVQDDKEDIMGCVKSCLDNPKICLIITVGGTGLCPRDVTPEATSALYEKVCTGLSAGLHNISLRYSQYAALSRLTAGICGKCLIINFPGKLKACKECFAFIKGILGHAIEQVRFNPDSFKATHLQQETSVEDKIGVYRVSQDTLIMDSNINDCDTQKNSNETKEEKKSPVSAQKDLIARLLARKKIQKLESPYPMVKFSEALGILASHSTHLRASDVLRLDPLDVTRGALGCVLEVDHLSMTEIPPFPVSTVDGFVVNMPKTMKNYLDSLGTIQAYLVESLVEFERQQDNADRANSFFCYRVNTGGRLPKKDFVIVMLEDTGLVTAKNLVPIYKLEPDKYIRKKGSDVSKESKLVAGTRIGPVELGALLSMGFATIKIQHKPTIGILSCGDELVQFHDYSGELDKVIDTNGPLLSAFFKNKNYPAVYYGVCKDEPIDILLKIQTSLETCDILIITGGASMGTKDHVKDVIEEVGGNIHFGRVNMKPGKPAAFASINRGIERKFIFALPGNPVSAFITSNLLVVPFVEHGMLNHSNPELQLSLELVGEIITVEIEHIYTSYEGQEYIFGDRLEFVRASLRKNSVDCSKNLVSISLEQQSSRLFSLIGYDCLIMLDPSLKGSKFLVGQTYQALKMKS